jgi:hypothetical protein
MATTPDVFAHLQSLASELDSQSNRVRQLIGANHWLSDGHHKEHLLRGLMQRFMPVGMEVAPGFIIDPRRADLCSREQDILVIDTMLQAPFFKEGGLVITVPEPVIGHVSVKSTFNQKELLNTLDTLASARAVSIGCGCDGHRLWSAGFFYTINTDDAANLEKISGWCQRGLVDAGKNRPLASTLCPIVLVCGQNLLMCLRPSEANEPEQQWLHAYNCKGLAPAIFLAMLLDHIHELRGGTGSAMGNVLNDAAISPVCDPIRIGPTVAAPLSALQT